MDADNKTEEQCLATVKITKTGENTIMCKIRSGGKIAMGKIV